MILLRQSAQLGENKRMGGCLPQNAEADKTFLLQNLQSEVAANSQKLYRSVGRVELKAKVRRADWRAVRVESSHSP